MTYFYDGLKTTATHIALKFDTGITSQVTIHIIVHLTVAFIVVCDGYLVS